MTLLEPDVFWSDIILGLVTFGCMLYLAARNRGWAPTFGLIGLATWIGAFYHGLVNTTETLFGNVLWSLTLLSFAAAATAICLVIVPKRFRPLIYIIFGLYALFAVFVSEKFIWALLLQAVALVVYGTYIIRRYRVKPTSDMRWAVVTFVIFVIIDLAAITIQQAKLTFGLGISHNTIFHIIEMPALILLAASMSRVKNK